MKISGWPESGVVALHHLTHNLVSRLAREQRIPEMPLVPCEKRDIATAERYPARLYDQPALWVACPQLGLGDVHQAKLLRTDNLQRFHQGRRKDAKLSC